MVAVGKYGGPIVTYDGGRCGNGSTCTRTRITSTSMMIGTSTRKVVVRIGQGRCCGCITAGCNPTVL